MLPEEVYLGNTALYFDDEARAAYLKSMAPEIIGRVYNFMLPCPYGYLMWWPWLKNYHGEYSIGAGNLNLFAKYVWIDQDLKEKMGY